MEDFDGVLLVELYRDSTDSYMEAIVLIEIVLSQDLDLLESWAETEFPQFECMLDAEHQPVTRFIPVEECIDWLTDIGCPE